MGKMDDLIPLIQSFLGRNHVTRWICSGWRAAVLEMDERIMQRLDTYTEREVFGVNIPCDHILDKVMSAMEEDDEDLIHNLQHMYTGQLPIDWKKIDRFYESRNNDTNNQNEWKGEDERGMESLIDIIKSDEWWRIPKMKLYDFYHLVLRYGSLRMVKRYFNNKTVAHLYKMKRRGSYNKRSEDTANLLYSIICEMKEEVASYVVKLIYDWEGPSFLYYTHGSYQYDLIALLLHIGIDRDELMSYLRQTRTCDVYPLIYCRYGCMPEPKSSKHVDLYNKAKENPKYISHYITAYNNCYWKDEDL